MSSNDVFNTSALLEETVWLEAGMLQDAEYDYELYLNNERQDFKYGQGDVNIDPNRVPTESDGTTDSLFPLKLVERIQHLEEKNAGFGKTLTQMSRDMQEMRKKINSLDIRLSLIDLQKQEEESKLKKEAEKSGLKNDAVIKNGTAADDDDDLDLFGSDEETEEECQIKEERLKAYLSKKAKKAQVIAKSSVVLDVKPWSDETDLQEMEINVRNIESAGLKWGAAKLVPLAYGIKKLQIIAIVEDDNCSIDWLQEQIEAIDELVQSVDIAAFNKL